MAERKRLNKIAAGDVKEAKKRNQKRSKNEIKGGN